jgi:tetratricopeptide (TPR) repeat protein
MLDRRGGKQRAASWQRLLQLVEQLDQDNDNRELRHLLVNGALGREAALQVLARRLMPASAFVKASPGKQAQRLRTLAAAAKPGGPVLGLITLARALEGVGDVGTAERLLRAAVAAQPDQVSLWDARGKLLERQGPAHRAEAIACYQAARAVRPRLGVALGLALLAAGHTAAAEEVFRDLSERQPDNPERYFYLGNALYEQKKLTEAVAAFSKGIALKPDFAEAYSNLGLALHDLKKPAEAVAAYHKAIDCRPDYAEAYYNLGNILRAQKKLAEAVAAYQKALTLRPDFPEAYLGVGIALQAQKKLAEAVAAYQKALTLRPDYALAYANLGHLLRDQKKLAEAVAAFRKADQLLPNQPLIRNNLRQTERLLELDRRLPALFSGKAKPGGPREQLELALFCVAYKERYRAAVRFFADALAAEPKLADDLQAQHRYNAACAAALAAAGKGVDASKLDAKERARLRQQALDWLRADLKALSKHLTSWWPGQADRARKALEHWQQDADLAALRDPKALAALPEKERVAWQQLWADVAALRKKADTKK